MHNSVVCGNVYSSLAMLDFNIHYNITELVLVMHPSGITCRRHISFYKESNIKKAQSNSLGSYQKLQCVIPFWVTIAVFVPVLRAILRPRP